MSYTLTVPLQVGDKVYTKYIDGDSLVQETLTVTEVCSKGFFVSAYNPPMDDMGDFIPYSELGKTYFVDGKIWMREEANHE